jgi:hypothetical protein
MVASKGRRLRWVRVAAWTSGAIVALYLLFVVTVNAMLAFGGIEAIVTRETAYTRLELRHGRAWMVWPTRVHVHDVTILIDTYSYQFRADIDEAFVDIRLLALFDRRFHAQRIDATGVDAVYRRKVDPSEADDAKLGAFAPFEETPPQVKSGDRKPQEDREEVWGVDLDDVDAQVDALWVDEFNTVPCGRVHGGLHWTAGWELEVPRTTVELVDASLWIGEHEAMGSIDGTGNIEIAPFITADTPAAQVPTFLTFDVELAAEARDPEAMAIYVPYLAGRISGGRGPVEAELHATNGEFLPGSAVHYRTDAIAFAFPRDAAARSDADVLLEVTGEGHPRVSVEVHDARLVTPHGTAAHVPIARGSLTGERATMVERWTAHAAHFEAPDVRVDDLRGISHLHPTDVFEFTGGSTHGGIEADLDDDGTLLATVSSRMRRAAMRIDEVRVTSTGKASSRLRFSSGEEILVVDRIHIGLDEVAVRSPNGASHGTWARIDDGRVRVRAKETTIEARGRVEDTRPALVHFTKLDPLVKAIPDLKAIESVEVAMALRLRPRAVDIDIERVEQLGLVMEGTWRLRGERSRGAFLFSGTAALGFAVDDRGLRQIVPAGSAWLRERLAWVRSLGGAPNRDARTPAAAATGHKRHDRARLTRPRAAASPMPR